MKELILCNSDNGFVVQEVDARRCKYCSDAFIYRENYHWVLTDRSTGIYICKGITLKQLEDNYHIYENKYLQYRKTDKYKIKVERFERMKLVNNYSKGVI